MPPPASPPVGRTPTGPGPAPEPAPAARFGTDPPLPGDEQPPAEPAPSDTPSRSRTAAVVEWLTGAAQVERLDDSFSLRHLFGNTFARRTQQDVELELMVGTMRTTPPLTSVRAEWPQPWLFARTLLVTGLVFGLFLAGYSATGNINLLPGLVIVGSFAMPITALIFFFETNVARNVSIVDVLRLVFLGGTVSLLLSFVGFELVDTPWLRALVAGLIEEPVKLLAVILVARQPRHRFILNGLLFGAAVGAGFAAFESAGFALVAALFTLDTDALIDTIVQRGMLSPLGQVVWAAVVAGALWRVKGGERLAARHLTDSRFWRVMVVAIVLHTIWVSPVPALLGAKFVLLGAVAWLVCLALVQEGIGQLETAKRWRGAAP